MGLPVDSRAAEISIIFPAPGFFFSGWKSWNIGVGVSAPVSSLRERGDAASESTWKKLKVSRRYPSSELSKANLMMVSRSQNSSQKSRGIGTFPDKSEIYHLVDFAQQVILGYQFLDTHKLHGNLSVVLFA